MKVLTILGSPRKNGKTGEVLDIFEKKLILHGHEIERIHIVDHTIKACIGCCACMAKNDEVGCILKDDVRSIFEQMILADAVIYASPIYWFDFTSQFKTLLDRHFCLTKNFGSSNSSSMIAGKKVALLLTCMGATDNNADLAQNIFDRSMDGILKCDVVGKYIIPYSSAPDFNKRAKEIADKLAKEIVGYI